jgi:hypothetical protein
VENCGNFFLKIMGEIEFSVEKVFKIIIPEHNPDFPHSLYD